MCLKIKTDIEMLPNLPTILEYNNIDVLDRYARDYPQNKLTPDEAFEELMKFFWLSIKHKNDKLCFPGNKDLDFICGIHSEMKNIDDMWHTFLLFTKDYLSFCTEYLGRFYHHSPVTKKEQTSIEAFELDLSRFLSFVYDNLGEESLVKWFGESIE